MTSSEKNKNNKKAVKTRANLTKLDSASEALSNDIPSQLTLLIPQIMTQFYKMVGDQCPGDLTASQFKLIQSVALAESPMRMSDLSKTLSVSQSTLTDTVKRLVRIGYLRRERSTEDDRVVYIKLTECSHELISMHRETMHQVFSKICQSLSSTESKKLLTAHVSILKLYRKVNKNG